MLSWIYLWETARGIYITDFNTYKRYVNCAYAFSMIVLVVLWITSTGIDDKLVTCFGRFLIGWIVTAVAALLISALVRSKPEDKSAMRRIILPCVNKVMVISVVLWLLH